MAEGAAKSRLTATIDLDAPGRHVGDLRLRWSDNSNPLGYHPVPILSFKGGEGPVLLVMAGVHGDEFEGPAAILRLAEVLAQMDLRGQVILLPAINAPAVAASSRTSPLDGANMNRAFPGDPDGGPTAMLAHYVETVLMPRADAVIDLHSGGKASVFAACALASQTDVPGLFQRNLDLAAAFGLPLLWVLGEQNDNRSVNAAALRAGVPMIAAELGGGGAVDPQITDQAEHGLLRCLSYLGILPGTAADPAPMRSVTLSGPGTSLHAPADGLFDRVVTAGDEVVKGQALGVFRFPLEPTRAALPLIAPADGFALAHGARGLVKRGELLALIAQDVSLNKGRDT